MDSTHDKHTEVSSNYIEKSQHRVTDNSKRRSYLQNRHEDKHGIDIQAGLVQPDWSQHIIELLYIHRFTWTLLFVGILLAVFFVLSNEALLFLDINRDKVVAGNIIIAISSLPIILFVWFNRAYDRNRELTTKENEHWNSERNTLLELAADTNEENSPQQLAAIRQLQPYLTGEKWATNQHHNTAAIMQLFSSICHRHWDTFQQEIEGASPGDSSFSDAVHRQQNSITIRTISSVLRSAFSINNRHIKVTNNNLSELYLCFLNIKKIDLSALNLSSSILCYANLKGANLHNTDLSNSELCGVNFQGAKLHKSDLEGVIYQEEDLKGVVFI